MTDSKRSEFNSEEVRGFTGKIAHAFRALEDQSYSKLTPISSAANWLTFHAGCLPSENRRFDLFYGVYGKDMGDGTLQLVGFVSTDGYRADTCCLIPVRVAKTDVEKNTVPAAELRVVSLHDYLDGAELFEGEHPYRRTDGTIKTAAELRNPRL